MKLQYEIDKASLDGAIRTLENAYAQHQARSHVAFGLRHRLRGPAIAAVCFVVGFLAGWAIL